MTGVELPMGDGTAAAALIAEARRCVLPMGLAVHQVEGGFVADLLGTDGRVASGNYGLGPDELLAFLAAEQRYLTEQEGSGMMRGDTYLAKAMERVRRGPTRVD